MHFNTITLLAGLAVAVQAAPASEHVDIAQVKTSYTITQEKAGKKPSGYDALAKIYAKYGKEMPSNIQRASAAATSGSVSASPLAYDEAYLSPVYIGATGQKFLLDFDTGSADLWVFSQNQASANRGSHSTYNLGGTKQSGETWKIQYGDGSGASGTVYTDKVVVAGITATAQSVEAASTVSAQFVSDASDGLLGLGPDGANTCSPKRCSTWTTTVAPQLAQNLFAVALKKGAPGTYDFGYINSGRYTGTIQYTPVTSNLDGGGFYWEYASTGYAIGSGSMVKRSGTAIPDTGTTLALVDTAIVQAYYAKVSGAYNSNAQGGYIFPCGSTLPSITFYTANQKIVVPGSYINYAPIGDGTCYGGLQSNSGIGFTILGDIFLKAAYVVFDKQNQRIGFAQQS